MTSVDINKEFGASGISRLMFEYIFDGCSIDMDYISDKKMEVIADRAESLFRSKYPEADKLFAIWKKEAPESIVEIDCRDAWNEYKGILKKCAIKFGGKVYMD